MATDRSSNRKRNLTVRLADAERAKLQRIASSDDRSEAGVVRWLIQQAPEPRRNPFLAFSDGNDAA